MLARSGLLAGLLATLIAGSAQAQGDGVPFLALDAGGHTSRAWTALFTPGDHELVTVSEDKTIRIWDVLTGEPLRTIRLPIGHGSYGMRYVAALFRDGKRLAVGGYGLDDAGETGAIYVVSLTNGQVLHKFTGHTDVVYALACSPDGTRLASAGGDHSIRLWNLNTGAEEKKFEGHRGSIYGLDFSPDGKKLVSASYDTLGGIWDIATGKVDAVLNHTKEARYAAWSPDGQTIATGAYDGLIRLWNANGTLRSTIGNLGAEGTKVSTVRFRADSKQLVYTVGSRSGPWVPGIIDVAAARVITQYNGHENTVMCGNFSNSSKLVATCDFLGEIHLWDPANGSLVRRISSRGKTVWSVGWNKTGTMIAFGNTYGSGYTYEATSKLERIFDLQRLEYTDAPEEQFTKAQINNGPLGLSPITDTSVAVVHNGQQISKLEQIGEYDQQYNAVRSMTLVSRQRAVIGCEWGMYLYDIRSGERLRRFIGHNGVIWAVSPSPDGRYFLSGCSDQTVSLWNPDRDTPLVTFFFAGNEWIAWTPEGYYAASAGGERLMGWHVNNGTESTASFFPAAQFRKTLYRPDIIKLLIRSGSLEEAMKLAGDTQQTIVADVLPPTVLIASPDRSPLTLDEPELTVKAVARQVGPHPVTSMQVYLDGRPVGGRAGKVEFDQATEEVRHEFRVTLSAGRKHEIAVRADSPVSHSMSMPIQVTYKEASVQEQLPALYVLAMGVSNYADDDLKLNYAANDAQKIEESFKVNAQGVYRKVETKLIVNDRATRAGVLGGLQWMKKQMTQHDIGVVFFSGHGDKDDTGNFYLLPSDVTRDELVVSAVSDAQVKGVLQGIPGRLLIMLDACHAGSLGGDKRKSSRSLTDDLVRDLSNDDYGVVVMASSMGREFSLESNEHRNGYFTVALSEGLACHELADANADGFVYFNELDTYVSSRVKDLTNGKQHPVTSKPATIRPFPLTKRR